MMEPVLGRLVSMVVLMSAGSCVATPTRSPAREPTSAERHESLATDDEESWTEDDVEPATVEEETDWRAARRKLAGSREGPSSSLAEGHAIRSLLPEDPTPEDARREGEAFCAEACRRAHDRARLWRHLVHELGMEPPLGASEEVLLEALTAGRPIVRATSSTLPPWVHYGVPGGDVLEREVLYTSLIEIDGEGLVSRCLSRLGREAELTYTRSCTDAERTRARGR